MISTDLDELLEICDRIAVLSRGRLVGTVENGPGAAEQVGRLMVGDARGGGLMAGRHGGGSSRRRRPRALARALERAADLACARSCRSCSRSSPAGSCSLALGRNPLTFYGDIWRYGVEQGNWQQSAITMVPLLLIATGLTVIFRANIWNLGYWGQFALGAALVAGYGPSLLAHLPIVVRARRPLPARRRGAGAAWTIVPAVLKARYGTNEIITTLMMSFVGVDLANILIKGPFQDPSIRTPQTRGDRLRQAAAADPGHAASTAACSSRSRACSSSTTC